jgi:chromate transporter
VIANLALFFALHTLFSDTTQVTWGPLDLDLPELDSIRPGPVAIAIAAAVMIFRLRWSVLRTLGACAALGLGGGLVSAALN